MSTKESDAKNLMDMRDVLLLDCNSLSAIRGAIRPHHNGSASVLEAIQGHLHKVIAMIETEQTKPHNADCTMCDDYARCKKHGKL